MDTGLGTGDGCELPATAIYWLTDDPQPGLVLVEFADAYGRPHQLVGKTASVDGDLQSTSDYPSAQPDDVRPSGAQRRPSQGQIVPG
ncbi:hypothetical protein GCM10010372_05240 [Streptomyces tauricus]|uniref:hypothetical protein n=1 Tax=Streptomyces tauricus TaxID=68274 RepID=UPI0016750BAA|nr:hypothetical protein [Streptomyces tauricus]MCW8102525.1 oligogalacturonate lyase family protein [Streptomyces tauricus]GHA08822.1 hypothetical protein GCM10010372_05240 [Streptomyces tauricus]